MADKIPGRIWMFALEYPPMVQRGGLGTHLKELVKGLSRMGSPIDVFVPHMSAGHTALHANAALHLCAMPQFPPPQGNGVWRARNETVYEAALHLISQGIVPDIIHCHDWYLFDAACRLRPLTQCKIVGTLHMAQAIVEKWGASPTLTAVSEEARMCREANRILTVSKSMRDVITDYYHLPESRVQVVYNGLTIAAEEASGKPVADRQRGKNILFAGRLIEPKGIVEVIKSAEIVLTQRQNVTYHIIGYKGSAYEKQLRDYCARSPLLRAHMEFTPLVKHEELQAFYTLADLALVPSRYEPFGYAALEPMLSAVCVIASDTGGLPEIIEDNVTGFLVPARADKDGICHCGIEELAQTQLLLLEDDQRRISVGMNARKAASMKFAGEKMCEETQVQYRQL